MDWILVVFLVAFVGLIVLLAIGWFGGRGP